MRRALLSAMFLFCTAISAAHAQIAEVYGTLSIPHLSNVSTGEVYTNGSYQEQYTAFTPVSYGGGITLNFIPLPVFSVGLDLRGSTHSGTPGADTALAGIKLSVHPPVIKFKPYIQASAGAVITRTTNVTSTSSTNPAPVGGTFNHDYGVFEVIGGVDYPLIHFVDFRIVEVGVGHTLLGGSDKLAIFNVNTGLVLHF